MSRELVATFKDELSKIKDLDFRYAVQEILITAPDDILKMSSSSTGKYHPPDEFQDIGMIKHIKRFAAYAEEAIRMYYDDKDTKYGFCLDVLVATAILHDSIKRGMKNGKHTVKKHPIYAYELIQKYMTDSGLEGNDKLKYLSICCLWHEGRWTIPESEALVPKSSLTSVERRLVLLAHTCDYVVSRRSVYDMMRDDFGGKE